MNPSVGWPILILAFALTGCGRSAPPAAAASDDLNVNGVRYSLPLTGTDMECASEFLRSIKSNGISWTGNGHTLEVADGKITLDSKSYGSVKAGDVLKLTANGVLSINGENRQPGE